MMPVGRPAASLRVASGIGRPLQAPRPTVKASRRLATVRCRSRERREPVALIVLVMQSRFAVHDQRSRGAARMTCRAACAAGIPCANFEAAQIANIERIS